MKTLKKTLCLVLAMVMVFGLCAVSASAELTYTDNNDISYKEAVDVMSGIGILQGDERGFRPTDDITRAEAAKILAYIMIGDSKQADSLKASSDPFTDVPATHWAAGYIAYCATANVIKGMGDGTYHPGDNVTGLQFATMLLRALGYGQKAEYEGTDWAINVSKDALRLGVFEKNPAGASATAKATREECALYAFNVIAGANDYEGIGKVSYSELLGNYITSAFNAQNPDANKGKTFGDDFNLVLIPDDGDDFGRMSGHSWGVRTKGNVISDSYYDNADLVGEYYAKVTRGDIADLLGASFINDVKKYGEYEVWVNGVRTGGYGATEVAKAEIDIDTLTRGNKDNLIGETASDTYNNDNTKPYAGTPNLTQTGNGVETLIYAGIKQDNNGNNYSWIRIVIVDTYLAKVTSVDKNDNVYVSVLKAYDDSPKTVTKTLDGTYLDASKGGNRIKAEGYKKGDYVLVNIAVDDAAVKCIDKAPTLEDTISRFQKVNNKVTITVSGTEYVSAKYAAGDDDITPANHHDVTATTMVDGKNHLVYLDKHGYFMGVADLETASDYVYVSHFGKIDTDGAFDGHALGAKVYYADGTNEIVTIKHDAGIFAGANEVALDTVNWNDFNDANVNIYKLSMSGGKGTLTLPGTDKLITDTSKTITDDVNLAEKQVKRSISTIVVREKTETATDESNRIKADGKTVFFYVNYSNIEPASGRTPAAANWDASGFSVKVYTGINNVRASKDNNATVEKYIEGPTFTNHVADAVLVLDTLQGETDDTVYFYTGNYDDNGGSKTVTYETYVNGELTDLVITYDSYTDKEDAIIAFNTGNHDQYPSALGQTDSENDGVKYEFFTLNSKNLPVQTSLVEWKSKDNQSNWIQSKEISKFCYEYDLGIEKTDINTDIFTFNAKEVSAGLISLTDDKGNSVAVTKNLKPLTRYDNRFAYGDPDVETKVIDLTSGKPISIGSPEELERALGSLNAPNAADATAYYGYKISNIKAAVQYANNTSNTVSCIYIVDYTATAL